MSRDGGFECRDGLIERRVFVGVVEFGEEGVEGGGEGGEVGLSRREEGKERAR